jgi:hypothetical protein
VRVRRFVIFSFVALVGLGCAPDVGPEGRAVGGPCLEELDCEAGSFCLRRVDFPAGTCTTNCGSDADCAGGSVCIEEGAGVCLLPCATDEDCMREDYACGDRVRRGRTGSTGVCVGG